MNANDQLGMFNYLSNRLTNMQADLDKKLDKIIEAIEPAEEPQIELPADKLTELETRMNKLEDTMSRLIEHFKTFA